MKTKLTIQIIFSIFVLAFGAWTFYEYKQSTKKQKESSFLVKELKELKAFRITKGTEKLEVIRKNQDWFLKKPVKDLASFTEISRWFGEIKNQKVQKIQTETTNLKDYYLDNAPNVEMEFNSGETFFFSVSKKSSFDGKYFIKKGEELFIAEQYFYSEVNNKDFDSFRSKKLLPALGHAIKLQFQGKENFTLHWANYKWSLDKSHKKNSFPLNSVRLNGFWTDVNSMKALELKEAVSSSSLRKYKLHKPQLSITLDYPNKDKKYTLKLSPFIKDKAFVFISHRDFILEISKEDAKKLLLSKKDIKQEAKEPKSLNP